MTRPRRLFSSHRAHFCYRGDGYFGQIELEHLVIDRWSFKPIKEDLFEEYGFIDATLSSVPYMFKSVVNAHRSSRADVDRK